MLFWMVEWFQDSFSQLDLTEAGLLWYASVQPGPASQKFGVFQLSEEEKTVHHSILWLPLVQDISCGPRIPGNSNLCEECCSCEWHCWKGKKTSWYRSTFKIITNRMIVMYCTFYYSDVISWRSLLTQCIVRRPEVVEQHRKVITKLTKEELEKC